MVNWLFREKMFMFKDILKGKVVIIGIGNPLRGDDGFGPVLIERLKGNIQAVCIDAGEAPENYIGKIIKERPDSVLIVDVVHLGLEVGKYAILRKGDLVKSGFTTHDMSLHMFIEHLEKGTQADIYILAVQPGRLIFGEEISDRLKKTLKEITDALCTNCI